MDLCRLTSRSLLPVLAILIASRGATAEPPLSPPSRARSSSHDLGTWNWSVRRDLVMTLRLQRQGDQLTGVLIGNDGPETEIQDGKYDDGILTFRVSTVMGKGNVTAEYAGIVAGNVINGGMRVYFGDRPRTLPGYMPWQAKRVKQERTTTTTN
jgi:hypothetical protein